MLYKYLDFNGTLKNLSSASKTSSNSNCWVYSEVQYESNEGQQIIVQNLVVENELESAMCIGATGRFLISQTGSRKYFVAFSNSNTSLDFVGKTYRNLKQGILITGFFPFAISLVFGIFGSFNPIPMAIGFIIPALGTFPLCFKQFIRFMSYKQMAKAAIKRGFAIDYKPKSEITTPSGKSRVDFD